VRKLMIAEEEFNRWQVIANACFHATKFAGLPWSIRVNARCPKTGERLQLVVVGDDETLRSAMDAMLKEPKLTAALERVRPILASMKPAR
jgi:hypothetical protein